MLSHYVPKNYFINLVKFNNYYNWNLKINLSSNITKIIKIPEAEIKNRTTGQSSIELWSYFLLTRTRSLIEFLFINRVKKFPPEF